MYLKVAEKDEKCFRIILAVVALFTIGASAAEPVCSGHEGWTPIYNMEDKPPSNTSGVKFVTYGIKITQPGNYYLAENTTCGRVDIDTPTANDTGNKQGSFAVTLCLNGKTVLPNKMDHSNDHGIRVGYHHSLTLTNCSESGGTLTVSGGQISENSATDDPVHDAQVVVNSYQNESTETFIMSAGTIGSAGGSEENALIFYRGVATISGGTIYGTTHVVGLGAAVTLTISGGTINGRLANKELPHPGAGSDDTCTISLSGGRFSDDTKLDILEGWLVSGKPLTPMTISGKIFYRTGGLSTSVCGCSGGTKIKNGLTIETDGSKYCINNYTLTGQIIVNADNVTLCLHGRNITGSSVPAIVCQGKNLNIVNGSENRGNIKSAGGSCAVQVKAGGSVTIGDNVHIDGSTSLTTAPVVEEGGSFTMNGGSVSGNTVAASVQYAGGAICAAGDVTLNCGIISGNKLKVHSVATTKDDGTETTTYYYGSNAVTLDGGTMTMEEHVLISGNTYNGVRKGNGGGVALYGESDFTMNGGAILGNTANTGGGVEIANDAATFTMYGGTISGNNAGRWGGGVSIRMGTFNLIGGTIKDNDLSDSTYRYGNQVTVGMYFGSTAGFFNMTGGEIVDTVADTDSSLITSTELTVASGKAVISNGSIIGQVGTLGLSGAANLNISAGTIVGDVTNAVPLPTTDQATMEKKRKNTIVNITGGEFYGALIETSHESRPSGITNTIVSGGKFTSFGDDTRETLNAFLDDSKGILSVMDISEDELVYEVRPGLVYNGAYMDFGSSLDLGLNLVAGVGDCTEDISSYTVSLSGTDADVKTEVLIEEFEGTKQLFVMAYGIAAKEMRDDITFTLKKDGEVWFTKTMSVYDAAKELGEGKDADYTAMLADMIHYGTQAQRRFGYNLRTLLSKPDLEGTSVGKAWTESKLNVSDGYAQRVSLSLSLKEQIELNFYIRDPQARIINVKFADETIPASDYTTIQAVGENDAYTMISFREIPITKAKETAQFTVKLQDGTTFDVIGGIADYVRLAQNDSTEGALVAALRNYVDSVYNVFSIVPETPAAARVSVEEL